MHQTIEAVIDEAGEIRLLEPIHLPTQRRVLVTILEEKPSINIQEAALLSEKALAEDWNRPEEDKAWSHLQSEQ
ncbi:MAG: hypothetical protein KAT34_20295 [Candidatus Aminicenantes bacterium]|nr:hypothetical protein [Candidatus Aminicenantes bacterium]